MSESTWLIYRGKCKEACEALLSVMPELRLVRGHYFEPIWNRDEPHWWLVDELGNITDPTRHQFPSKGIAEFYTEFDGNVECSQCGKIVPEEEASFESNYCFCSHLCHGRFVGVL